MARIARIETGITQAANRPRATRRSWWLLLSAVAAFAASFDSALAQWPSDPAVNLAIADRTGEQVQTKIRVTSDGGAYISWFDNATGGYDVYLQRVDSAGQAQWAHNGILLADRNFSWTMDYDLDMDTTGNALVTFRDENQFGTYIIATKVSPEGVQLWGDSGVQLGNGTAFVAAPKIAGTTDGYAVVAWTNDDGIKLQRLDADGAPTWDPEVTIDPMGADSVSASDLEAAEAGGVIISMVRGFMSPKHLHAQKFDSDGAALWGATPMAVFDGGALQTANFPQFIPDGSGGAVFSWYSVSAGLQCHAQRVLADGTEQFGHNGVIVSTLQRDRTMPAVSFNPTTEETFVFWREETLNQFGVYGQKLGPNGTRLWTNNGLTIEPMSTTELVQVRQIAHADGAIAFWVETLSFGDQRIHAARVDGNGAFVWDSEMADVSTVASSVSRLAVASVGEEGAVAAWSDGRNDANDVYGQNINSDGTLGANPTIHIVSSEPSDGAIDARQPSEPDGSGMYGWSAVLLTFDGDTLGLTPESFTVTLDPPGIPPFLWIVSTDGNTAWLQFGDFAPDIFPVGHWTIITHNDSDTSVRIGYLPADVNNDRLSNANDVLALINALNGFGYPLHVTDIDRSGVANASDILRVIDLLNGAGAFDVYLGASLPD